MSHLNSASCVTCEARNKKCDGMRGPNGCRRCLQAGIACEGFLSTNSRIPKLKHNIREDRSQPNTTYLGHPLGSNNFPETMTPTDFPASDNASQSRGNSSALPTTCDLYYLDRSVYAPTPRQSASLYDPVLNSGQIHMSSTSQITAPVSQMEENVETNIFQPRSGISMIVPSQANPPGSRFNRVQYQATIPLTPDLETPGLRLDAMHGPGARPRGEITGREQISQSQSRPTLGWAVSRLDNEPETGDAENLGEKLLAELVPDRRVESNTLPFIIHAFASWLACFVLDPTSILPIVADYIRRSQSFERETHHTLLLVSDSALAISRSTDYELSGFATLHNHLVGRVMETRRRGDTELTREMALATMDHSHQFISTLFKVGSLASVLSVMDLYAPVFRRACPEPREGLVNLPRNLINMNIHLRYYAALDVLQSLIAHRPMFFRYDLDFLSPHEEKIIKSGTGTGLRWLYGLPDQLMIILGRMNSLFEDFGSCVDPKTVQELKKEIEACMPIVSAETGTDPSLNVGRIVVQESWGMAALVYLYMGLCGAKSSDSQVVKVQKAFMKLLGAVQPRRNPDSFLVLPIFVMGVATTSPEDRSTLLGRLWGVPECNRPETVGNDIVRMLNDIWKRTTERPAVWADIRTACLRVTGM
ncbi:unnamed protein product [Rhizoctonia solani]|uniref:Zn(2)-C6 fungal-type domain-containing protein n=1 Tax=Rhizoctonia solani TaxID=456999 RepID=A0A8H3GYL2_9AGAM|nr:unnamed protein product [Rhizoctonia solani]